MSKDIVTDIAKIESILGRFLPEGVRSMFLGEYDHIELPCVFQTQDESHGREYMEFFWTADEALDLLERDLELLSGDTRDFPPGTVPVGFDGNGDHYVASVREQDFGSIYLIFHETCDPMDESLDGAIPVSRNLPSWVASFRHKPHDPEILAREAAREAQYQALLNPRKKPWWKFWR